MRENQNAQYAQSAWAYQQPALLLQRLIQFDTTNPPGNEWACIDYIRQLLNDAGCQTTLVARDPDRPNLLARIPGRGEAPPLLLQGHVDVTPTIGQQWRYPPFEGRIVEDCVWGRGAADMKGGVAMMVAACLRAIHEQTELPGDVVLALVADEEAGGTNGAKYLVEEHADYFKGIRYAIGEFGGNTVSIAGKQLISIPVQEKQACWVRVTLHGEAGHAAQLRRKGLMWRLTQLLQRIEQQRLPVHIQPIPRAMFETYAKHFPDPLHSIFLQLLDPMQTDTVLDQLGSFGQECDVLLHHTMNVTTIRSENSINVLPSCLELSLDARLLPGYTVEEFLAELRTLLGQDVALEVLLHDPVPPRAEADMGLFPILQQILHESNPQAIVMPTLQIATSDARFFARLGIQTYGFLPTNLPPHYDILKGIHSADEYMPIEGVEFGAQAIFEVLKRNKQSA